MGAPLTLTLDLTHSHHRNAMRALLDAYDAQPEPIAGETAEQFAIDADSEPQEPARLLAPEPEPKRVEDFEVIEPKAEPAAEKQEVADPEPEQPQPETEPEREPGEDDEPAPPVEVTEISLDDFTVRFKEIYKAKGEEASGFLRTRLNEYGIKKVNDLSTEQRVTVFNELIKQFDSVPF